MKRKLLIMISVIALAMLLAVPVFAKNFNLPEGASVVYWEGGEVYVQIPGGYPPAPAATVTTLKIEATHILADSGGGKDEASVMISVPYKAGYLPVAYFTTNPDALSNIRKLLSGLPASYPTNSLLVSDNDLIVERHGNRITAESKVSHNVMWTKLVNGVPKGVVQVTIPAFSFALDKVGGSAHVDSILPLYGYTGASNYTAYEDEMGFNANGAFTGPAGWGPVTDCFVIMHGITTSIPYVPPTP